MPLLSVCGSWPYRAAPASASSETRSSTSTKPLRICSSTSAGQPHLLLSVFRSVCVWGGEYVKSWVEEIDFAFVLFFFSLQLVSVAATTSVSTTSVNAKSQRCHMRMCISVPKHQKNRNKHQYLLTETPTLPFSFRTLLFLLCPEARCTGNGVNSCALRWRSSPLCSQTSRVYSAQRYRPLNPLLFLCRPTHQHVLNLFCLFLLFLQALFVFMALSFARDEIIWLLRHADNIQKKSTDDFIDK